MKYEDYCNLTKEQIEEQIKILEKIKNEKTTPKKVANRTHVALILDRSGSMESCRNEAITGFNEQVETLKKSDHPVLASFTVFSTKAEIRYIDKPIGEVENLTTETYIPSGWTSLYDAIGLTIDKLREIKTEEGDAFLVQIFSDGQENTSKEYTSSAIAKRIKELQDSGNWTFTYFGSNQDLARVQRTFNFSPGNMASYTSTRAGTARGMHVNSSRTNDYLKRRAGGQTQVKNFYGDSITTISEK